ncbi:MAG TPA: segregation/condensation protein A [Gemmataceae bacterium]|nr:segregation/condensation protein A [Gemmataceae bacterium]
MEYQVELDSFRGPVDLLLYLVKHNEVDILDLPIARIADQFLSYLNLITQIDVDWAGEFLVMAATLTEIKSRMVLPRAEAETPEGADPRLELVKQLVEYKRFKDAAALLEAQAEKQLTRLPRQPVEMPAAASPDQQPLRRVELWDLVSAFGRLMRETQALQPQQIVLDDTPQQVHMDRILEQLRTTRRISFTQVFVPPHTRGRLLGMFLAVLELIKGGHVIAEQPEAFGEIWVSLAGAG